MFDREAIARKLCVDHPTPDQLALMNACKKKGQADFAANEMISVPILASDNLLREDLTVWQDLSLESMRDSYRGQVLTMDHDWEQVNKALGFVYDAELFRFDNPGPSQLNLILDNSINAALDYEVIKKCGKYQAVICYAAIPADSPAINAIRYLQLNDVSTGGYIRHQSYECPLCGGDFGKEDPHYKPDWGSLMLVAWGDIEPEDVAPYAFYNAVHFSKELSFVTAGNVPSARIFDENLTKLVWL